MTPTTQPQPQTAPDTDAMQQVYQLGTGFIVSAALGAAIQLNLPDHLAAGPRRNSE
jgi:hypothetical protein